MQCYAWSMSEALNGAQPYDSGSYAKIVTRDASPAAGAAAACVPNMRRAWQVRVGLVQGFYQGCPGRAGLHVSLCQRPACSVLGSAFFMRSAI